jgi:hypothetical protein
MTARNKTRKTSCNRAIMNVQNREDKFACGMDRTGQQTLAELIVILHEIEGDG